MVDVKSLRNIVSNVLILHVICLITKTAKFPGILYRKLRSILRNSVQYCDHTLQNLQLASELNPLGLNANTKQ